MVKRIYGYINHALLAGPLHNLGACYEKIGNKKKANECFFKSSEMEKNLSKD